jgi:eukaryotic-like serine/threonine-protein kinase
VVTEVTRTGAPISTREMLERSELLAKREFAAKPDHLAAVLDSLASAYRMMGEPAKALELLESADTLVAKSNDTTLQADVQCHRGWMLAIVRDKDSGSAVIENVLSRRLEDALPRANCLRYLAFISQDVDDGGTMLRYAQEAHATAQKSPSYTRELDASYQAIIAAAYELNGEIEKADQYYGNALAILEAVGAQRSPDTLVIRSNRAVAMSGAGNPLPALREYDAILEVLRADDPTGTPPPYIVGNRAAVLDAAGRIQEAQNQYAQSLQVARELKNERWLAYSLAGLAETARKQGDLTGAKDYLDQLAAMGESSMPPGSAAWTRYQRAVARNELAAGHVDKAKRVIRDLLSGDAKITPDTWLVAAEVEWAAGNAAEALAHAKRSLQEAEKRQSGMSHSNATGVAWFLIGRIQVSRAPADAKQAWIEAEKHLSHTVDESHPALTEVRALLAGG